MSRYGFLHGDNQAIAQPGITDTPVNLRNLGENFESIGVDRFPITGVGFVARIPGPYLVFAQLSFQKDSADDQDNFHIFLYKNGVNTGYGFARNLKTGEYDLGSGSFKGILDLYRGDVLELYIYNDAGSPSTITVIHSQFGLISI